jgi:hypothetical protein
MDHAPEDDEPICQVPLAIFVAAASKSCANADVPGSCESPRHVPE